MEPLPFLPAQAISLIDHGGGLLKQVQIQLTEIMRTSAISNY